MDSICQAIAKEEGFGVPGGRATRNNNPGDISWGPFARTHGATSLETIPPGIDEPARFAVFPDPAAGFAAMKALLEMHYAGQTVEQMIYHYAPPNENDTDGYIANVCKLTGLTPNTVIDQYL